MRHGNIIFASISQLSVRGSLDQFEVEFPK